MKLEFNPYVVVYVDNVDIYDVHQIIIDEDEKTIDCSDYNGFMIANICYENLSEVGYLEYDDNGLLTGEHHNIIFDGKLLEKYLEKGE